MSASVATFAAGLAALLGRPSERDSSWAASWMGTASTSSSAFGQDEDYRLASLLSRSQMLYLLMGVFAFLVLAYATNPSEASFRSHLTDLSFHLHLRRLRAHEFETSVSTQLPGEYRHGPAESKASAQSHSKGSTDALSNASHSHANGHANDNAASGKLATSQPGKADKRSASKAASQAQTELPSKASKSSSQSASTLEAQSNRSHVLSFSSRVSISLRTPTYAISNYVFLSIAKILPPANNASTGSVSAAKPALSKQNGHQAGNKKARKAAGKAGSTGNAITDVTAAPTKSSVLSAANSAREPWSAQGGLFVGFMGYWWTIDDGTSASGTRERARLSNLVSALEEEKDDTLAANEITAPLSALNAAKNKVTAVPDISEQIVEEPASLDSSAATSPITAESSASTSTRNAKPPKSLTNGNGNATIRGGQRRSSPIPRGNSTGPNATRKKGNQHQSASSGAQAASPSASGDSTPRAETELGQNARSGQSSANHVRTVSNNQRSRSAAEGDGQAEDALNGTAAIKLDASNQGDQLGMAGLKKDADADVVSLVSHSASAAEAAVSTITPAAAHLQSQLDDLRASSAATQARLEAELSDLRSRNKDEDSVRAELKIRTKALEEGKRSAESARLEAERKLITARGNKKAIEDRVGKTKTELGKLEKREREIQERLIKARSEREEKLNKLREEVKSREGVLAKEEEATLRLEDRVHALEVEIEDRKLELNSMREDQANAVVAAHQQQQQQQQQQLQLQQQQREQMHHAAGGPPSSATAGQRNRAGSGRHPNAATPVLFNSSTTSSSNSSSSVPPGLAPSNAARQGLSSTSSQNLSGLFDSHGLAPPSTQGHPMFPFPDETPLRPPTPSKTPPGLANRAPSANSTSTFGSASFLDHRANKGPTTANPASALYRRMHMGEDSGSSRIFGNSDAHQESQDEENPRRGSGGFGSFAPFGPASPAPSDTSNATATSPQLGQGKIAQASTGDGYFGNATSTAASGGGTASPRKDSPGYTVPGPISPPSRSAAGSERQAIPDGSSASLATSGAGYGPLSPMTPHQASLIPSQLFDLLDDVEMPASPSPALSSSHGSNSGGSHFPKHARVAENGSPPIGGHNRQFSSNSGGSGPWGDIAVDEFDFDKPLGGYYSGFGTGTGSGGVSRRASARNNNNGGSGGVQPSAYSPLLGDGSSGTLGTSDSIFSLGHGHHGGSLGSIGTRSSSTGSISPSLASAGQGNGLGSAPGSGKLSPNDILLLEKARHAALALNPDAKAFSFNRPLPSSGSSSSLGAKDPRMAFDAGTAAAGIPGQNPTWASPLLGNRGAPAGVGQGQSQQQNRSASNPTAGSSFSPFDDDELLKRW